MSQFERHALSAAFPSFSPADLDALAADIRSFGQREPGLLLDGQVLDGWNRYRACTLAGVEFVCEQFDEVFPGVDPRSFVKSKNLHRRHLTDSQRAAAVVAVSAWAPSGRPINPAPGAGLATTAEMAREADVSPRTINHAKVAHRAGLGDAVIAGEMSAKAAASAAKGGDASKSDPGATLAGDDSLSEASAVLDEDTAHANAERDSAADELAYLEEVEQQKIETLVRMAHADDKLADALKLLAAKDDEIIQLRREIRALKDSRDSKMNTVNEQIRRIKALTRENERLVKAAQGVSA